jgi:hypothetical protein
MKIIQYCDFKKVTFIKNYNFTVLIILFLYFNLLLCQYFINFKTVRIHFKGFLF